MFVNERKMNDVLNKIRFAIKNTKFENHTYICGGYVRDILLGIPSTDIDLVVELENGGIELAHHLRDCGVSRIDPIDFSTFGVSKIIVDDIDIEIIQTRKESYRHHSRKPKVIFGSLQDDARRRDFTINSMYINVSTRVVIDMINGKDDLNNKILRTTDDPDIIFKDDPLRIIRAVRFATKYNLTIDNKTSIGMKKNIQRMEILSVERIRDEFCKILMLDNFKQGLDMLIEYGIIDYILPELKLTMGMDQPRKHHVKDVYSHIMDVIENSQYSLDHRLAALLHDIGKINTRVLNDDGEIHFYGHSKESSHIARLFLTKFKFPNEMVDRICEAVYYHMAWDESVKKNTIKKRLYNLGYDNTLFAYELACADSMSHINIKRLNSLRDVIDDAWSEITNDNNKIHLPFTGDDIMKEFNIAPSKEVGRLKDLLIEIYFEDQSLTKEQLFEALRSSTEDDVVGEN